MGYSVSINMANIEISAAEVLKLRAKLDQPLEDELNDWCFGVSWTDAGEMILDEFMGEKWHDEDEFFKILAPHVISNPEAEIFCLGEDGDKWKYGFEDGQLVEYRPTITWERVSGS